MTRFEGLLNEDELELFFNSQDEITIIGFGSLISETSSRGTFPTLTNFREARIEGHRRLFIHPAFIFFERGIANLEEKKYSSLCTEPSDDHGFVATVFEVSGQTKQEWLRREEEFVFRVVPYTNLADGKQGMGLMCSASESDDVYIGRWGREKYESALQKWGLSSIWHPRHEGILPCDVYLRHCVLAASGRSNECSDSFLDETFLSDRSTTIRQYLENHPNVMESLPPETLLGRYSG